jgi:hypothetical protein
VAAMRTMGLAKHVRSGIWGKASRWRVHRGASGFE